MQTREDPLGAAPADGPTGTTLQTFMVFDFEDVKTLLSARRYTCPRGRS